MTKGMLLRLKLNNDCLIYWLALLFYLLLFLVMIMSKSEIMMVIKGVLSSAIGVQSEANRRKAFEQVSWQAYVIAGFIFVALFIGLIILIVNLVL